MEIKGSQEEKKTFDTIKASVTSQLPFMLRWIIAHNRHSERC